MKVGEEYETAWWLTGDEPPELLEHHINEMQRNFQEICAGFELSPMRLITKHPMDDDVPEVPDHISGPNVRLLVGEVTLTGIKLHDVRGSFVENLDRKDRVRLRYITRKSWAKMRNTKPLSDDECDSIIEEIGPEAALDTLRTGVDGRTIH